ncbi:MAG: helix-turn-helix domain-containing protein [Acidobacteriia bacterium]|nr:helix-turn-helix domain-containing protein [Terriglobia bacterium]
MVRAGEQLRQLRNRLGLTTRDVADLSRKIATEESNDEFSISHARLIQIENDESTPSIYKLFTLSAVYGRPFTELVSLYVDLEATSKYPFILRVENTRLAQFDTYSEERAVSFPVRFDPGFKVEQTNLVSRMVEIWGDVPVGLLQHLNIRKQRYGFIGLKDYTMYPLLRPGSFVQIDDQQKVPAHSAYRSEFDRPIWFLELRTGYLCSWCEMRRDRIVSIPHPLSPCRTQEFAFPNEAEIVGRVTAVAARLVNAPEPPAAPPAGLPAQA